METRERNSINYNNPPQSNQDSSPRLNTPLIPSPASNTRRNETLNHHHQDFNMFQTYAGVQLMAHPSKKRFRTKFSQEQKDKMFDFAERIGWKIQKQDEQEVLRFCNEVGLKKEVFKVWMHNNKQGAKKK
ncbi:hypothetical protein L1987_71461 [Smallanthus sonchifolius]|uniref:Uncharacterized protein n=1 Tax=Smallanthus sonchifolius TaxID=185202 RepID=A0ACB9ARW3_9ASTR|nr:hypothetical protein L1987_71461 [Smallanthus sonchifolius]